MNKLSILLSLIFVLLPLQTDAFIHHGIVPIGLAPVADLGPEIVGLDYPNNGASTALSGTTLTLSANNIGRWDNSPVSYSYNWHTVSDPGTSLGTGVALTIDTAVTPAIVGQAIEVDVTATNPTGSASATSYWVGPIETSVPTLPNATTGLCAGGSYCIPEYEDAPLPTLGSASLPIAPAQFLQNGHAIFPGCVIPPAAPAFTSGSHVWYFDPVNGATQDSGASGHLGQPFNDLKALFNAGESGYSGGKLFGIGQTIAPGDTIYIEPGNSSHPVGDLTWSTANYSTSDGTQTGTPQFTWIMMDPAAASIPVIHRISFVNGGGFFIVKNLNVEQYRENGTAKVALSGPEATPVENIHFENMSVTAWLGHSSDPWPGAYPNLGGSSDGTIITAAPTFTNNTEDGTYINGTASAHSSTITFASPPPVGAYVWSHLYYVPATTIVAGCCTGIPNGTKIISAAGNVGTIGPCDPIADHSTGCPAASYPGLSGSGHDNVPGCDPLTNTASGGVTTPQGGCPGGPVPAWNGTTRSLSNEQLSFTGAMTVVQPDSVGYWNQIDWNDASNFGITFQGVADTVKSQNPSNPNYLRGATCLSVKDSTIRDGNTALHMAFTNKVILYHNRVKFMSGDAIEIYTNNRDWMINNWYSDPTNLWAHQDAIQFGSSNASVSTNLFNNAAVDNEFYQQTDPTNWFPREMQGITTTENIHWFMYVADNIVNSTTDGINIGGKYNVLVHNDVLGQAVMSNNQHKASVTTPLYALLANNIGNGVTRGNDVAGACGAEDTVGGNISLPFDYTTNSGIVLIAASGATCSAGGTYTNQATAASIGGISFWTSTQDWGSAVGGVTPLFTDFRSIVNPPVDPAVGWIAQAPSGPFTPCVNNTQTLGFGASCTPGTYGVNNLRPNHGFTGFTPAITVTTCCGSVGGKAFSLPAGATTGVYGIVTFATAAGITYPAGLWQACPTGSGAGGCPTYVGSNPYTAANGWYYVGGVYDPPIINAGINLGIQAPIADHDGKAWGSPPSVGAYQ